jgi:hypothetical protein
MATLTNNISAQNIVDRFADYVVATGNASIGFASNAVPFGVYSAYFPNIWGGDTSGKAIGINGTNLGGAGSTITASTIVNVLRAETTAYTRIRNLRALLFITGTGYITPRPNGQASSPTDLRVDAGPITGQGPGYIYDSTQKANLSTAYLQTLGATASTGISSGSNITTSNLETFFTNLRTAYAAARDTTHTQQVDVCHASCHTNCHSSRGRR